MWWDNSQSLQKIGDLFQQDIRLVSKVYRSDSKRSAIGLGVQEGFFLPEITSYSTSLTQYVIEFWSFKSSLVLLLTSPQSYGIVLMAKHGDF